MKTTTLLFVLISMMYTNCALAQSRRNSERFELSLAYSSRFSNSNPFAGDDWMRHDKNMYSTTTWVLSARCRMNQIMNGIIEAGSHDVMIRMYEPHWYYPNSYVPTENFSLSSRFYGRAGIEFGSKNLTYERNALRVDLSLGTGIQYLELVHGYISGIGEVSYHFEKRHRPIAVVALFMDFRADLGRQKSSKATPNTEPSGNYDSWGTGLSKARLGLSAEKVFADNFFVKSSLEIDFSSSKNLQWTTVSTGFRF